MTQRRRKTEKRNLFRLTGHWGSQAQSDNAICRRAAHEMLLLCNPPSQEAGNPSGGEEDKETLFGLLITARGYARTAPRITVGHATLPMKRLALDIAC